ncbi:MAG: glycosyltransferase family 39 protein, partial [Chloroflexi bacterium]|nr:glycosyltransferase family 39 protein [Chloroflexota bacterium]
VPRARYALAALAIVGILALYGWLLAPQLGKPFVYDDVNFALGARAVAHTGLPYGNQGYLLHLYREREQWALWHPPLYIYALGLTTMLFGESEAATRGLSVLCQLLAAGLSFDLARRLAGPGSVREPGGLVAGVLAVALFLLGPLTVQAAGILDIDNTVLMLLTTLFVWVLIRLPDRWPRGTVAGLAIFYGLLLWAKLTTPLLLLAAMVFTRAFGSTGWRGALEALTIGALGWALFLVSWLVVTGLTGMPADYTFIVVSREALESGTSTRDRFVSWAAFAAGAAPAVLWLGPFFCLLFVLAGLPRLWRLLRGRGLEPGDLVVVLGAAIYLVYIMKLAGSFPKYHAAMLPLWTAASGAAIVRAAGRPSWGQLAVMLVGFAAVFGWLQARADLWAIEWDPTLIRLLIVVPLLVGLAMGGLWAQLGRVSPLRAAPISLAALALAWSLALNVHQRGLDGSTTYYYGRYGQVEAARALEDRLQPDELYIASKEVAWYSRHQRYVDQESWQHVVWDLGQGFDGTWLDQPVRVLALELGERSVRGTYERALAPRYRPVGEYGNFVIFERAT